MFFKPVNEHMEQGLGSWVTTQSVEVEGGTQVGENQQGPLPRTLPAQPQFPQAHKAARSVWTEHVDARVAPGGLQVPAGTVPARPSESWRVSHRP